VEFHGGAYALFVALFAIDAAIALFDVLVEPSSRRNLGGLFGGEYLAHITLSVMVGAMLHALWADTRAWIPLPTEIRLSAGMPPAMRAVLALLAVGCALVTLSEAARLISASLGRPGPIHVRARFRTSLERLWRTTQDHRIHPLWDHRFDRIIMLGDRIATGTRMIYGRSILGVPIRGFGRYVLHAPMRQSTFEFGSHQRRSLIEKGRGVWLYRPSPDGWVEFSTAYTYQVRWGLVGRLLDRALLRPWLRRMTHESFARLGREWLDQPEAEVRSAIGPRPSLPG
jgi:hypothetical protein